MALLTKIDSWAGKRVFFCRNREILVDGQGNPVELTPADFPPDAISQVCEDTLTGAVGVLLAPGARRPQAAVSFPPPISSTPTTSRRTRWLPG